MPALAAVTAAADAAPWAVLVEHRVVDPAAVEVLWHPAKRVHLGPFLGRAAGLAEAAQLLRIKKTAMSYWLNRLLDLELIRPWCRERRGGRQVWLYRCVADRLSVSLRDAPMASYEAAFDDISERWHPTARRALGRSLTRQAPWLTLNIAATDTGGMVTDMSAGPGAPADDYLFYWGRLWLTAPERDALRRDLDALWDRYAALSDRVTKPCPTLMHLVTVPDHAA